MASPNEINPVEYLDNTELSDSFARARTLEILDARPGMSIAAMGASQDLSVSVLDALASEGQLYHIDAEGRETRLPAHCCDRVLLSHAWERLEDPIATLGEARRILRPHGRLIVIEWRERIAFEDVLQILERTGWDIHRHGDAGVNSYFIEAGISDESVQS